MNQPRSGYTHHGTQTIPEPLPPPDTRSWDQRVHEQNLTTIANETKPLSAMLAFSRQNVVLGIELDLLSVRVKDAEAANTVLSTRIEGLQSVVQFLDREKLVQATTIRKQADDIQRSEAARKKIKTDLMVTTEQSRNRQSVIDMHTKNIAALKEQSDENQSTYLDGIHELERANNSLTTQLNETKKAHNLLLQQVAPQSQADSAQSDNRQKDKAPTKRAIQGAISASSLIRSQKVIEEQDDKIIEMTSKNTILKKQLKEALMWKAFYKSGELHYTEDLQRKAAEIEKLANKCDELRTQMETQRREHTESADGLFSTVREDKETIQKMAATIRQDKLTIEELQKKIRVGKLIADGCRRVISFTIKLTEACMVILFILINLIITGYFGFRVFEFFWKYFWRFICLFL